MDTIDRAKVANARAVFGSIGVVLSDEDAFRLGEALYSIGVRCELRDAATEGRSELAEVLQSIATAALRVSVGLKSDEVRRRLGPSAVMTRRNMAAAEYEKLIEWLDALSTNARLELSEIIDGPDVQYRSPGDTMVGDLAAIYSQETGSSVGFPMKNGVYTGPFVTFVEAFQSTISRTRMGPSAIRTAYRRSRDQTSKTREL